MRNKALYSIITLIIIISLLITTVSCKSENSTVVNSNIPEIESTTMPVTSKVESTVVPVSEKPTYSDYELARAVELGIGEYAENTVITHKQFCEMLDVVVALIDEDLLPQWQKRLPKARVSTAEMTRTEGMIEIYYAAETLGIDYIEHNTKWDTLDKLMSNRGKDFIFDESLYPDIYEPTVVGPEWNDRLTGADYFSLGRISMYSGKYIFDYDEKANTMHFDQPLMYEDALRAAVRLYDSNSYGVAMRVPTKEDEVLLAKADERRIAILNSPTTVTVEGQSYYVSNSGDDSNDGLSPDTAWATLKKVNRTKLAEGDGVFFERGGLWRGLLKCQENVTYSAYGDGQKPRIYGSPENGADPEKWSLMTGTDNIWVFYKDMYDTGGIIFNEGESWALRLAAFWDGSNYVDINDRSKIIGPEQLENNQVFSAVDYTGYSTQEACFELEKKGKLYLRCDEGNPGDLYGSIEFLCLEDNQGSEFAVIGASNNIIDNLCVKYTNASGVIIVGSNSTVQNCEVGWVGGAVMNFYEDENECIFRVGDCINLCLGRDYRLPGKNNAIINCYAHHAWDMALVSELTDTIDPEVRYVDGIVIRGNLTEKSSGGITLTDWASLADSENWDGHKLFRNVLVEDNYVMYTGYGWSHQERELTMNNFLWPVNMMNSSIMFGYAEDGSENLHYRNNLIYLSKYALVGGRVEDYEFKYDVEFERNTYVQNTGGVLAQWAMPEDETIVKCYPYNHNAQQTVEDVLGDKTGITFGLN